VPPPSIALKSTSSSRCSARGETDTVRHGDTYAAGKHRMSWGAAVTSTSASSSRFSGRAATDTVSRDGRPPGAGGERVVAGEGALSQIDTR
jgi:hypothetical protein